MNPSGFPGHTYYTPISKKACRTIFRLGCCTILITSIKLCHSVDPLWNTQMPEVVEGEDVNLSTHNVAEWMQDNWALWKLTENTLGYIITCGISTKAVRMILQSIFIKTNPENQTSLCCNSTTKELSLSGTWIQGGTENSHSRDSWTSAGKTARDVLSVQQTWCWCVSNSSHN